jgi:hypothetical protein
MARHQITDLYGIPFDFTRPRMDTSVANDIQNRAGSEHDAPVARTQYASAPPRVLPSHVQSARRRQVQINAMTGAALDAGADDVLLHEVQRAQAHATAINRAIHDAPSSSGSVGGGLLIDHPSSVLPHLFFGAR